MAQYKSRLPYQPDTTKIFLNHFEEQDIPRESALHLLHKFFNKYGATFTPDMHMHSPEYIWVI